MMRRWGLNNLKAVWGYSDNMFEIHSEVRGYFKPIGTEDGATCYFGRLLFRLFFCVVGRFCGIVVLFSELSGSAGFKNFSICIPKMNKA